MARKASNIEQQETLILTSVNDISDVFIRLRSLLKSRTKMHTINTHFLFLRFQQLLMQCHGSHSMKMNLKKKGGHLLIRYLFHNQFWGSHSY